MNTLIVVCVTLACVLVGGGDAINCDHDGPTNPSRKCSKSCQTDTDCVSSTEKCLCDGECGSSCVNPAVECNKLYEPNHGVMTESEFTFNSTIHFACNPSHNLVGSAERVCQANRTWSGEDVYCEEFKCLPDPQNISHGWVTVTPYNRFEAIASYSCQEGYTLVGQTARMCQANETWTGDDPTCAHDYATTDKVQTCGPPPQIKHAVHNGSRTQARFSLGTNLSYTCIFEITNYNQNVDTASCLEDGQWLQPKLMCIIKECNQLPEPNNGLMEGSNISYGSVVRFVCHIGYTLYGSAERTCQANGTWSGEDAKCEVVDCPDLHKIKHGRPANYLPSQYNSFKHIVSYSCERDYHLEGLPSFFCQSDGTWAGETPRCEFSEDTPENGTGCQAPPFIYYMVHNRNSSNLSNFSAGTKITWFCIPGYTKHPDSLDTDTCDESGNWVGRNMTCNFIQCNILKPPDNSNITGEYVTYGTGENVTYGTGEDTSYGSVVRFTCHIGYRLVGSAVRICQDNGTWSGQDSRCEEISCGKLGPIFNGYLEGQLTTVGSEYDFRCNNRTTMVGPHTSTRCLETGEWSHPVPVCLGQCQVVPIKNGTILGRQEGEWMEHGSLIQVTCDTGFVLNYRYPVTCDNGTWSVIPKCVHENDMSCGAPPQVWRAVHNQPRNQYRFAVGTILQYTCLAGFTKHNESEDRAWCVEGGTWVGPKLICNKLTCGVPPQIQNTIHNQSLTQYRFGVGTILQYTCIAGFIKHNESEDRAWCVEGGTWVGPKMICNTLYCHELQKPNDGVIMSSTFTYASVIRFACDIGYTLVGSAERSCQANATWSGNDTTCELTLCAQSLEVVRNRRANKTSSVRYLETTSYRCDRDYNMFGNPTRMCQSDGTWTSEPPICRYLGKVKKEKYHHCMAPEPVNYTEHSGAPDQPRFNTRTKLKYTCLPGYAKCNGSVDTAVCDIITRFWKGLNMCCNYVRCDQLERPDHGRVITLSGVPTFGIVTRFICLNGYTLVGSAERTCQKDGSWSGQKTTCEEIHCGVLEPLYNGYLEGNKTAVGDVYFFRCNNRTTFMGPNTSTRCLDNGEWSHPVPLCLGQCQVPHIINATFLGDQEEEWKEHDYTLESIICFEGWDLNDTRDVTCVNGTWSNIPVCVPIPCDTTLLIDHGHVKSFDLAHGWRAEYMCDWGYYEANNQRYLTCHHGRWSGPTPKCVSKCGSPPHVQHAVHNGPPPQLKFNFGTSLSYTCIPGFSHNNDSENRAFCVEGGVWLAPNMTCNIIHCNPLDRPHKGSITGSNTEYGSVVRFVCKTIYKMLGSAERTCQANGTWSGQTALCRVIRCPVLKQIKHGLYTWFAESYNGKAWFQCSKNYILVGTPVRYCQSDGTWTGTEPICELSNNTAVSGQGCEDPPEIPNTEHNGSPVQPRIFRLGINLTYTCYPWSSKQNGSVDTAVCDKSRQWVGPNMTCSTIKCNIPERPLHGNITVYNPARFSSIARFVCDIGYRLVGSALRICQADGTWDGQDAVCEEMNCGRPGPIYNGYLEGNRTSVGSIYVYKCNNRTTFVGPDNYTRCLENGQWSHPAPLCLGWCQVPAIRNATIKGGMEGEWKIHGHTIEPKCDSGYYFKVKRTVTCENGNWSFTPRCVPAPCATPPSTQSSGPIRSDLSHGRTVQYVCLWGYKPGNDSLYLTCRYGKWNGPPPECINAKCQVPDIVNATVTPTTSGGWVYDEDIIIISCHGVLEVNDSRPVTCNRGDWSHIPSCVHAPCDQPPVIDNGYRNYSSLEHESIAHYFCFETYNLVSAQDYLTCVDGNWTGPTQICERPACNMTPPLINYGDRNFTGLTYGCTANYSCWESVGVYDFVWTLTCEGGKWVGPTFSCEDSRDLSMCNRKNINQRHIRCTASCDTDKDCTSSDERCMCDGICGRSCVQPSTRCPTLVTDTMWRHFYPHNRFGALVKTSCSDEYILQGHKVQVCQGDGTLFDNRTSCVLPPGAPATCGPPPAVYPMRPVVNATQTTFNENTNVSYTCHTGWELTGQPPWAYCMVPGWRMQDSICKRVQCEIDHKDIQNGERFAPVTHYGHVLRVVCHIGYRLVGSAERTCQANGSWSGQDVTCEEIRCPEPANITNGWVTASPTNRYQAMTNYFCEEGYIRVGPPARFCQGDGTWSGDTPSCELYNSVFGAECGPPYVIQNAEHNWSPKQSNFSLGTNLSYTCLPGFTLNMSSQDVAVCADGRKWVGPYMHCNAVQCDALASPDNCVVTGTNITYGSVIKFTCNIGYKLVGSAERICQEDGTWSGQTAACEEIDCGLPPNISSGYYVGQNTLWKSVVEYRCNEQATSVRENVTTWCMDNGQWSPPGQICLAHCQVPILRNGYFQDLEFLQFEAHGVQIKPRCDPGFILDHSRPVLCINGSWSFIPKCIDTTHCNEPSSLSNGMILYMEEPRYGSAIFYFCNKRYQLVGPERRLCQTNSTWSGPDPICEEIDCGPPEPIYNGRIEGTKTKVGYTYFYWCNERTTSNVEGYRKTECQESGMWSHEPQICLAQCQVPKLPNGQFVGVQEGEWVTHSNFYEPICFEDFTLYKFANSWAACNNGSWAFWPKCYAPCRQAPPQIPHATVTNVNQAHLGKAFYECDKGYTMMFRSYAVCNDSKWVLDRSYCKALFCHAPEILDNGQVYTVGNNKTYEYLDHTKVVDQGTIIEYRCNENFTLEGSSVDQCAFGIWSKKPPRRCLPASETA